MVVRQAFRIEPSEEHRRPTLDTPIPIVSAGKQVEDLAHDLPARNTRLGWAVIDESIKKRR